MTTIQEHKDENHAEEADEWESLPHSDSAIAHHHGNNTVVLRPQRQEELPSGKSSLPQNSLTVSSSNYGSATTQLSLDRHPSSLTDKQRRQERLQSLKRKVDTKIRLQRGLVDHPMQLLWSRFLFHFYNELTVLDRSVQLAFLLIALGVLLQVTLLSTWYMLYPRECARVLLFFALIAIPLIYLNPNFVDRTIKSIETTFSSEQAFADAMSHFDSTQLRRLALFLVIVPTLLEMWALHFLSQVHAEVDWISFYNIFVAALLAAASVYFYRFQQRLSPRECTHRSVLLLYAAALVSVSMVVICHHHSWHDLYRALALIAPTLIASGILLLNNHETDQLLARVVRYALRLALRDALQGVSTAVQQDEMLQLAMLRWIVDYWSNEPVVSAHGRDGNRSSTTTASENGTRATTTRAESIPAHRSTATGSRRGSNAAALDWNELFPMLTATTDQLAIEVQALQQHPQEHQQGARASSNPPGQRNSQQSTDPVTDLRSMLASMNIDDHAKPAVMAYKRGVQAFPPRRRTSIFLSVIRRCPALWLWMGHLLFGWSCSFSASLILIPLVALEVLRAEEWARRLNGNRDGSLLDHLGHLDEVDSMVILLSGDTYVSTQPPTLLVVWRNIIESVDALEVSLTAARCVQTTAVAVDFAGNILSLAQFGLEVSQHGWAHGVGVLVKEWVVSHGSAGTAPPAGGTQYTHAARSVVGNSQILHRNVSELVGQGEDVGRVFAPLVGFVPAAVLGWMFSAGNGEAPPKTPSSTVVIEEVDDSSGDDKDPIGTALGTTEEPVSLLTSTDEQLEQFEDAKSCATTDDRETLPNDETAIVLAETRVERSEPGETKACDTIVLCEESDQVANGTAESNVGIASEGPEGGNVGKTDCTPASGDNTGGEESALASSSSEDDPADTSLASSVKKLDESSSDGENPPPMICRADENSMDRLEPAPVHIAACEKSDEADVKDATSDADVSSQNSGTLLPPTTRQEVVEMKDGASTRNSRCCSSLDGSEDAIREEMAGNLAAFEVTRDCGTATPQADPRLTSEDMIYQEIVAKEVSIENAAHFSVEPTDKGTLVAKTNVTDQRSPAVGEPSTLQICENNASTDSAVKVSDDDSLPSDWSSSDSDDGFEPIHPAIEDIFSSKVADMVASVETNHEIVPTATGQQSSEGESKCQKEDEEDNNLLLQIGGGLAVVGGIFGAVAFAAASIGGDKEKDKRKQNE